MQTLKKWVCSTTGNGVPEGRKWSSKTWCGEVGDWMLWKFRDGTWSMKGRWLVHLVIFCWVLSGIDPIPPINNGLLWQIEWYAEGSRTSKWLGTRTGRSWVGSWVLRCARLKWWEVRLQECVGLSHLWWNTSSRIEVSTESLTKEAAIYHWDNWAMF